MAEVLSPHMQPTTTISMLHPRPSSADAFQGSSQQYPQSPRLGQQTRSMYNGQNTGYRGVSAAPVQPYAFQSTPTLRSASAGSTTASHGAIGSHRHAPSQSASNSSTTSSDASSQPSAKDDSVMGSRNGSLINLSSSIPDLSLTSFDQPAKASPDRYRRPAQKRTESGNITPKVTSPQPTGSAAPSGSGMSSVSHLMPQQTQPSVQQQESVDDIGMNKTNSELAKRYRRRSLNNLETSNLPAAAGAQRPSSRQEQSATSTPTTIRPVSLHSRTASGESHKSQREKHDAVQEKENAQPAASMRSDPKGVAIPPRTSSEAGKKLKSPSPLSKETSGSAEATPVGSPVKQKTYAAVAQAGITSQQSLAAQHLAAVSDKDLNKGMKSRLRRAFSFGSAQELRRAAGENNQDTAAQQAQQAREQHQQHIDDELDAEQQEIARRQEAAGIGAGIYSGQGGFTGSTDNLSISSTASSASMMLRKMGRGAKKSARSIKGLFRPKSVIGVPAADGPISGGGATVQPSVAQVSMVTVEAERQKVNVNEHPADNPHGSTGFPKLERNSIDAANGPLNLPGSRGSADGSIRPSIIGSDKDRAAVLKGIAAEAPKLPRSIIKKQGVDSPSGSPNIRPTDAMQGSTKGSDSPASSMPSTPKDGRTGSLKAGGTADYFGAQLASTTTKTGVTPGGTVRSITFSPRIQFHDAFSSTEYDRRGEIATCNRLTPMLAQQIKEELNTFKMEMEVHELSKPHTHFF